MKKVNLNNITTKEYTTYLFKYGILTILYLLEHFENVENYEQCKIIIDTIRFQEKRLDLKLHTKIDEFCMKDILETYSNFGLTGKNVHHNSKIYRDLIIKQIK